MPLDFTRIETRRAKIVLIKAYPTNHEALTLAEDAGLDLTKLDQTANVTKLFREILKKARLSERLLQLFRKC